MKRINRALDISKLHPVYEKQWVALFDDEVLASGSTLQEVLEALSAQEKEAKPIFFWVPPGNVTLSPAGV